MATVQRISGFPFLIPKPNDEKGNETSNANKYTSSHGCDEFVAALEKLEISCKSAFFHELKVDADPLKAFLKEHPHLETISISAEETVTPKEFIGFDDTVLVTLAENCPHIKSIRILDYLPSLDGSEKDHYTECQRFSDASIEAIANHCPDLENLSLPYTENISDKAIAYLAEKCPKLKTLDIRHSDNLSDEALYALAKECTHLERLYLIHSGSCFTTKALHELREHCSHLAYIKLGFCPQISPENENEIIEEHAYIPPVDPLKRNQRFELIIKRPEEETFFKESLESSQDYCFIDSLSLREKRHYTSPISTQGSILQKLPEEQKPLFLDFSQNKHFDDESIVTVTETIRNLKGLDLSYAHQKLYDVSKDKQWLTGSSLRAIAKAYPDIEYIALCGQEQLSKEDLCEFVQACPKLKFIDFSFVENQGYDALEDDTIKAIADSCPDLEYLLLNGCDEPTDASISYLAERCPNLKVLDLGVTATELSDISLIALARHCKKLHTLRVSGEKITDTSLVAFAEQQTPLRVFSISCASITDEGSSFIMKLPLERISIDSCDNIGNDTIRALTELSSLEILQTKELWRLTEPSQVAIKENGFLSSTDRIVEPSGSKSTRSIELENATDETVIFLSLKNHHLEDLTLRNSPKLSDKALFALARSCPHLKTLILPDSGELFTPEALFAFKEEHPYLRVVKFGICPQISSEDEEIFLKNRNSFHYNQFSRGAEPFVLEIGANFSTKSSPQQAGE